MIFDTSGKLHDDPATTNVVEGVRRHDYLPFGEENVYNAAGGSRTAANGYLLNDGVRQQFTGHERDSETGLDFMQARYYASGQGRFASADEPFADQWESDPQSWNLYTYVRNSPLNHTDPFGLWKKYVDGNNIYYIAEKGDTYTSLAKELGTSVERVEEYFAHQKTVQEGVYYDVTTLQTALTLEKDFLDNLRKINLGIPNGGSPGSQPDTVDPRSPWKQHYPGVGGFRRPDNNQTGNIFSQGNQPSGSSIKEIFDSIWKSGKVPAGWRPAKGGTTKVNVNNKELLEELRKVLPGQWKKVYRKGADGTEIHYFEHESGKVFDVKPK